MNDPVIDEVEQKLHQFLDMFGLTVTHMLLHFAYANFENGKEAYIFLQNILTNVMCHNLLEMIQHNKDIKVIEEVEKEIENGINAWFWAFKEKIRKEGMN